MSDSLIDYEAVTAAYGRLSVELKDQEVSPGTFVVETVDGSDSFYLAVDELGQWSLLIEAEPAASIAAVSLQYLSVEYRVAGKVVLDSAQRTLTSAVIRCLQDDPEIRKLFATVVLSLIRSLPNNPSEQDIDVEVTGWRSLFRALQNPSQREVTGLIGELILLGAVTDIDAWVDAWHVRNTDPIDFAWSRPNLEVEVKATTQALRQHTITLQQITVGPFVQRYFASVMVHLRNTGVSVGEYVQILSERFAQPSTGRRFQEVVVECCGSKYQEYMDTRFVRADTEASLEFYQSSEIPKPEISLPLPLGVSGIKYISDFSGATAVDDAEILGRRSS